MSPISIEIPSGARITNQLFPTSNSDYLTQDLVTIALPNGCFVDVGWYPEHDPTGEYFVRVFYEYWDAQLREPFCTRDPREAAALAEELARVYSRQTIPAGATTVEPEPGASKSQSSTKTELVEI